MLITERCKVRLAVTVILLARLAYESDLESTQYMSRLDTLRQSALNLELDQITDSKHWLRAQRKVD